MPNIINNYAMKNVIFCYTVWLATSPVLMPANPLSKMRADEKLFPSARIKNFLRSPPLLRAYALYRGIEIFLQTNTSNTMRQTTVKRKITLIVIHCSATRCNRQYTVQQLYHDHVEVNHWRYIGYHFYIRCDGTVEPTRPLACVGAHAKGYNAHSIGICYEGGLDEQGRPADTRTEAQKKSMERLIVQMKQQFPSIVNLVGHHDLPGVHKDCPCFDARQLKPLLYAKAG